MANSIIPAAAQTVWTVSEALSYLKRESGLSDGQLAARIGIPQRKLEALRNGTRMASEEELTRLFGAATSCAQGVELPVLP